MATLLNKSMRVRVSDGHTKVGDRVFGAPGGHRASAPFVCSHELAEQLAAEVGLDVEHAHRYVVAMGRVAQRLLMRGQPIGIPHVGVLFVKQTTHKVNLAGLRKAARKRGRKMPPGPDGWTARRRHVMLHVPMSLSRLFADNVVFTCPLREHIAIQRQKSKTRYRRFSDGSLNYLRPHRKG